MLWLRSTDYSRTFASLKANFQVVTRARLALVLADRRWQGLFPPATTRGANEIEIASVHARDMDRDYLMGGDGRGCPQVATLIAALNKTGAFNAVQSDLSKLATRLSVALNASIGVASLMPLRDNALARLCHGLPQFAGLSDALLAQLDANLTTQYYLRRSTPALQKFSIGPFFNQVLRLMNQVVKSPRNATRYAHTSAHDSTLTAVNAVLGRTGQWPPYASHVEIELWRDADGSHYVQVAADGQVYRPVRRRRLFVAVRCGALTGSASQFGAQVDMLPLSVFAQQLQPVLVGERDWRVGCGDPYTGDKVAK